MADYRCYWLNDAARIKRPPEHLEAHSDAEAQDIADNLYRFQHHAHGYELWQGSRLLVRRMLAARPGMEA